MRGQLQKKMYSNLSKSCIRILRFHQQLLPKTHRNSPRVSLHLQIKGLCFPWLCIWQQHGFQELQDLLANWLQFIPGLPMKQRAQFTMVHEAIQSVWVKTSSLYSLYQNHPITIYSWFSYRPIKIVDFHKFPPFQVSVPRCSWLKPNFCGQNQSRIPSPHYYPQTKPRSCIWFLHFRGLGREDFPHARGMGWMGWMW